MAKTLFIAVLTLCVSATYAEQFQDLKGAPDVTQWNEAAAAIGMNALIVEAGKEMKPDPGKVYYSVGGQSAIANSSFPVAPSKTTPGQIAYHGPNGKIAPIVRADSKENQSLVHNLLKEVLKVANGKDEKKAKAASLVASELLRVNYGKTLEQMAPRANSGFAGASGLLGKGKGKGGLHLGGDLDLGGGKDDGHAKLPEAAPAARLLSYMENPKAWVQATDCGDGTACTPIPGQVMNPKLGGNLAIDDKMAAAFNYKDTAANPANAAATASPEAEAWLLEKLKSAKKSGQTKFLVKFGADTRCPPCRSQTALLKKIDPSGSSMLSVDVDSDAFGNQIFHKLKTASSIPLTVVFDLSGLEDDATESPAPVWAEHGVSPESTVRSQLGK